jgi:hypothetical protein
MDWEELINNLDVKDLPEDGKGPPAIEMFKKGGKQSLTLEDRGTLKKVITEILIFEHENGNTFTGEAHYMVDYGSRPLKAALAVLKDMKKKMA